MIKGSIKILCSTLLVLCTLFYLNDFSTEASTVELFDENSSFYSLGKDLSYLEDKEKKLSIDTVQSPEISKQFKQSNQNTLSFKYTDSNIWLHFKLKNPFTKTRTVLLEHSHPFMNKVDLFVIDEVGNQKTKQAGIFTENREVFDRNHVFKLTLSPNSEMEIYLCFSNSGRMYLPLKLWNPDYFYHKTNIEQIILGVFYGVLIAILIYSIFIFLSLREEAYFKYAVYLCFFLLYQLNADGVGHLYLWPGNEWILKYSAIISWNFLLFFYILFSLSFLNTKATFPKAHKFFLVYATLFLINILFLPINGVLQSCRNSYFLQLTLILLLVTYSGFLTLKKHPFSQYYFIAMFCLMCGGFLNSLPLLKSDSYFFLGKYGLHLGSILEIIILAFGLSNRLKKMRTEKEKATLLSIEMQKQLLKTKEENIQAQTLRNEAEEANRLKSEFLATISHELRTPMQSILGWSKLAMARMEKLDKKKLYEYFSDIALSGNRLLNLINDLLDISKKENGGFVYTYKEGKLSNFTTLIIQELNVLAEQKNITIHFNPPENETLIKLDPFRISQVIRNLLANAIKFSAPNKQIQIDISQAQEIVNFTIKDNGIGVPDADKKSIFEKFTQSNPSHSTNGGTGLGLAIAKQIIEDHSGKIWIEDNVNKGSVFKFFIPKKAVQ